MKITFLALVLLSFQFTQAQESEVLEPDSSVIDNRQQRQENRVQQGLDSGSISKQEQRRLKKEQVRIKRMEKRAQKDGKVTAREKKKISHAQNRASHSISKKKHNKK